MLIKQPKGFYRERDQTKTLNTNLIFVMNSSIIKPTEHYIFKLKHRYFLQGTNLGGVETNISMIHQVNFPLFFGGYWLEEFGFIWRTLIYEFNVNTIIFVLEGNINMVSGTCLYLNCKIALYFVRTFYCFSLYSERLPVGSAIFLYGFGNYNNQV